jgi:Polyketide cyclase / dehydrase and lipid transport
MGRIRFEGAATLDARPAIVWDILTDYRNGHSRIVPKPYFSDLTVEQGDKGAGTVIAFTFRAGGTTRHVRHIVSTPEPGRVLVESETDGTATTTYTLTQEGSGARTHVRIVTDAAGSGGLRGALEALFLSPYKRLMARIYLQELANLEALARTWNAPVQTTRG